MMIDNLEEIEQRLEDREEEIRKEEQIQRREEALERRRARVVSPLNDCERRKELFASK